MLTTAQINLLIPIVGALLVGALTGFFALTGARAGARNEATKWRREKRLEAYSKRLSELDAQGLEAVRRGRRIALGEVPWPEDPSLVARLVTSAEMALLGPDSVHSAAVRLAISVDALERATRAWIREARPPQRPLQSDATHAEILKAIKEQERERERFLEAARSALQTSNAQ